MSEMPPRAQLDKSTSSDVDVIDAELLPASVEAYHTADSDIIDAEIVGEEVDHDQLAIESGYQGSKELVKRPGVDVVPYDQAHTPGKELAVRSKELERQDGSELQGDARPGTDLELYDKSRRLPEEQEILDGELLPPKETPEKLPEEIIDAEVIETPQKELMPAPAMKELSSAPEKKDPLTFVTVDQSVDAERYARDAAERRLDERLNEEGMGLMTRLKRKIWDGNIAKDYLRHKYTQEALRENIEQGSIYANETSNLSERQAAELATVNRMRSDLTEMHNQAAGERREDANPLVEGFVKDFVRRAVAENFDDATTQEEFTRALSELRRNNPGEVFGRGLVELSNAVEIVAAVRGAIEHGESMDSVIENMRVISAESRSGVRTNPEERYNAVDNIMERMAASRIGTLVSPEALGTATVVAASVARIGARTVAGIGAKMLLPVGGALLTGTLAAARENKRLKDDFTEHSRQMAQGRTFEAGDSKREEMEKYRLDTVSITDLISSLEVTYADGADLSGENALRAALESIAAVETRIAYSDENDQDRIQFSDTLAIEDQRFQLALARAQAKAAVNKKIESLDPVERAALGLENEATVDSWIQDRSYAYLDAFNRETSEKQEAFNKYRHREARSAGAKAAAFSLVGGAIAQEVVAGFSGSRSGLIEQAWGAKTTPVNGEVHQTLLERTFGGDSVTTNPSDTYASYSIGDHGSVSASGGASFDKAADGTYEIKGQNGDVLVSDLSVDDKGAISTESQAKIEQAGLLLEDNSESIQIPSETTKSVSLGEYMKAHHGETTSVTRDLWYDNDTAQFDRNELGLQNRVDDNGNFVFDLTSMTEGGSTNGGNMAHVKELAKEGNLKIAVSPSAGTQQEVFMLDAKVETNAKGEEIITAVVPKDSPVAEFARVENGQAVFDGKYAEASQVVGVDNEGVTHMRPLATEVGTDSARTSTFEVSDKTPKSEMKYDYRITARATETPTFTEVPGVLGTVGRRSMGVTRRGEMPPNPEPSAPEGPGTAVETTQNREFSREVSGGNETAVLERVPSGAEVEKVSTPPPSPLFFRNRATASRVSPRPSGDRGPQTPRIPGRPGERNTRTLENPVRKKADMAAANIAATVNDPNRARPFNKMQVKNQAEMRFGTGGYEVFEKKDTNGRSIFTIKVTEKGIRHYNENDHSVRQ